MTNNSPDLRTPGAPVYGDPSKRRRSIAAGSLLSLLLHVTAFWFVMHRDPMIIKPAPPTVAGGAMAYLSPLAARPRSRQALRKPPSAAPRLKQNAPPKQDQLPKNPAAITEPMPAPVVKPDTSTPDDMFAYVQAARKRRADAEPQPQSSETDNTPPAEDANQRANRIARENVAFSQKQGAGAQRDDSGGLFQLRHVGLHNAEFLFRGWNVNFRRNSSQMIAVDQGGEIDIETAVIKKMIEIIRSKKSDDFIWDSHRLGKEFTLSAKPEHSIELQKFLMREFFPDYAPLARR